MEWSTCWKLIQVTFENVYGAVRCGMLSRSWGMCGAHGVFNGVFRIVQEFDFGSSTLLFHLCKMQEMGGRIAQPFNGKNSPPIK